MYRLSFVGDVSETEFLVTDAKMSTAPLPPIEKARIGREIFLNEIVLPLMGKGAADIGKIPSLATRWSAEKASPNGSIGPRQMWGLGGLVSRTSYASYVIVRTTHA